MSKYGFDENEIRRSVVDMVDKDGFHKEFVVDGKYQPDESEGFKVDFRFSDNSEEAAVLMLNIPLDQDLNSEDALARMYTLVGSEDIDWVRNIGDSIGEYPYDGGAWGRPFMYYPNLNAAADILFMFESGEIRYYQVYVVDNDLRVIDRKKLEIYKTSGD